MIACNKQFETNKHNGVKRIWLAEMNSAFYQTDSLMWLGYCNNVLITH